MYHCVVATVETIFPFFPFLPYVGIDPFYLGLHWPFVRFSIHVYRTSAFFPGSAMIDVRDPCAAGGLPLHIPPTSALVVDPLRILPLQTYSDVPTLGILHDARFFHSLKSDRVRGDIQPCD